MLSACSNGERIDKEKHRGGNHDPHDDCLCIGLCTLALFRCERLVRPVDVFGMHENPEIIRRAPLHNVASYLQMTPETLSRVRAQVTEEGIK